MNSLLPHILADLSTIPAAPSISIGTTCTLSTVHQTIFLIFYIREKNSTMIIFTTITTELTKNNQLNWNKDYELRIDFLKFRPPLNTRFQNYSLTISTSLRRSSLISSHYHKSRLTYSRKENTRAEKGEATALVVLQTPNTD